MSTLILISYTDARNSASNVTNSIRTTLPIFGLATTDGFANYSIIVGVSLLFVTCRPYSVESGIVCWNR